MADDAAAQIAALRATVAQCDLLLNGGTKSIYENGRRMEFDLDVVRQQRANAASQLAALTGMPPQVRRVLISTPLRGY